MSKKQKTVRQVIATPIVLFFVICVLFFTVSYVLQHFINEKAEKRFEHDLRIVKKSLITELETTEQFAKSISAFVSSAEDIDKKSWDSFINEGFLKISPFIKAISYAPNLSEFETLEIEQAVKSNDELESLVLRDHNKNIIKAIQFFSYGSKFSSVELKVLEDKNLLLYLSKSNNNQDATLFPLSLDEDNNNAIYALSYPVIKYNDSKEQIGHLLLLLDLNLIIEKTNLQRFDFENLVIYDEFDIQKNNPIFYFGNNAKVKKDWFLANEDWRIFNHSFLVNVIGKPMYGLGSIERSIPMVSIFGGVCISLLIFWMFVILADSNRKSNTYAKEMNYELEKTNNLFQSVVNGTDDLVFVKNKKGEYIFVNKEFLKLLKLDKDFVIGKTDRDLFPKDFANTVIYEDSKVLKNKKIIRVENSLGKKHFLATKGPFFSKSGKLEGIFGIARDISHMKNDENSMLKKNIELEEAKIAMTNVMEDLTEEKNLALQEKVKDDAILQGIGEGLVVIDNNRNIKLVNHAAMEFLKYSKKEDLVGQQWPDVLGVHSVTDQNGRALSEKEYPSEVSIKKGKTFIASALRLARKDHVIIPVKVTVKPMVSGKNIVGAVIIFRDITKESEIDKAKTEFVSLASHQLRTPLSAINWYTEILQDPDEHKNLTDKQKEYVSQISIGNQRMIALVNALLNVSRIELSTFGINPEPVFFKEIIDSVLSDVNHQIKEKKQKLKKKFPKNLPTINLDKGLMHIVVENLVTNSVKYTKESGTVSLELILENRTKKDKITSIKKSSAKGKKNTHILFVVKDNGMGIPEKDKKKIFSKLYRADNVKKTDTKGTGLGLYITKSLVKVAGGDIWYESKINKGTTFYVRLPLSGMKKKEGEKKLS